MINTTKLSDTELLDSFAYYLRFLSKNDKLIIFFYQDIKFKKIQAQYEFKFRNRRRDHYRPRISRSKNL